MEPKLTPEEQLAAERAAREAAEQERDAAQALAGSLSEELHRVGKEIERYSQRSRDEDTTRIRLNHARIEERDRADAALAQLAARDQEIAALRKAGEALWVELEDAAHGYEGVHWKVQRDAPPALDAWRALHEPPTASVAPCTCRDAASACGACMADAGVPYPRPGQAPSGR